MIGFRVSGVGVQGLGFSFLRVGVRDKVYTGAHTHTRTELHIYA